MIVKRIKKHVLITNTRLNQKNELAKIAQYQNNTLKRVVDSILTVKNSNYTIEDRLAFENCEKYRTRLLNDNTIISYEIFGSDKTAMVKDICNNAASSKKWCEFFYYLAKKTSSPNILEIGTNLGISGCYALEGIKNKSEAKFITMEGLSQLCEIASKQFDSIVPDSKYEIKEGLFETTFPLLLKENTCFNLVFIDGNHRKDPTIAYFDALKTKIQSPAIYIFDDINWSKEMNEAWEIIKKNGRVNFAIDLYKQGVVIIDEQESAKNITFNLHLAY